MNPVEINFALVISALVSITCGVIGKICYDWLANGRRSVSEINNKSVLDSRNESRLIKIGDEVEWLKDVHAKADSDGMPVWYVPRELKELVKESSERAFETNILLKDIKEVLKENGKLMRDVMHEVQNLKK